MDVNNSHPSNAPIPIDVTEDGMVIDVRFVQLLKAHVPIDVIFDDVIFTVFKLVQLWNVLFSIDVTPDGIEMDGKDSHP